MTGKGDPKNQRGCCSTKALLIANIISLLIGIALVSGWGFLLDYIVSDLVPISSPSSILFNFWMDSSSGTFDLTRKFWFYNLTNPDDVLERHEIPNFQIIGPFVYRENSYQPHNDVSWTINNSLQYKYHMDLHFMPERSIDDVTGKYLHPDKARFTMLNLALAAVTYRISLLPNITFLELPVKQLACDLVKASVTPGVSDGGIFTSRTVTEFLFGYKDKLWTELQETAGLIGYNIPTIIRVSPNHSIPAPSPWTVRYGQKCPTWDDVSICNCSDNQDSFMFSGTDWSSAWRPSNDENNYYYGGKRRVGQITKWVGQDSLWWWGEGRCQLLRGSNAMLYKSGLTKEDRPFIYFDQLYRQIIFEYRREVTVNGIPALEFRIAKSELEVSDDNTCYDQTLSGVFNLTRPTFAPMMVTQPHFFYVDETTPYPGTTDRALVNLTMYNMTLKEWKARHTEADSTTYVHVLPVAGIFLQGSARMQINYPMEELKIAGCDEVFPQMAPKNVTKRDGMVVNNSQFPRTLFPLYYGERYGIIGPHETGIVNHLYLWPKRAGMSVGIFLISVSIISLCIIARKHAKQTEYRQAPASPTTPLREDIGFASSDYKYDTLNSRETPASSFTAVEKKEVADDN